MDLKDYSRIEQAIDINRLHNTHIVCVGTGGSYGLCESLTRSGLGRLSVIDFDIVEESNLVRQGYAPSDIGRLKVEALKLHLGKINSKTEVVAYPNSLQEVYQQQTEIFEDVDLILFLTDSFQAQALGNKIALEFQKPAIWAGYYERSHCAEIVFYIPTVTPACFRCGVSPRYKIQEQETIVVSSNSNMVFHSQLLDSYIGMLTMAILHNETEGYEYSNWFGKYWDRSLIQFKVHPKYEAKEGDFFHRVFSSTGGRAFNFNSIWQSIERELPPKYETCPDCGHLK
jgi:hypothetical protein